MEIRATVLCENTVSGNIGATAEHGWSVFLETSHGNFLFDTGQGLSLINNALFFKKDLSTIKGIIISHNHSDHTGGLMAALSMVPSPVNVYSHPEFFKECYINRNGKMYIGVPFSKVALESSGANFIFSAEFREIAPGLHLTGQIPRVTDFETGDQDIVCKDGNDYIIDPVKDDQSIVIETEKGLFIILGCSHAGVINIIDYAIKKTGQDHIHTVIGGTHLGMSSEEQVNKTIEALKTFKIEHLGVSHCTGLDVSVKLAQEFKDRFFFCNVGTVVTI